MNHKQLVQQMSDMKAELDKYQAELTQLRSQVATYEDVEEAPAPVSTTSRRKLLRRMAIAGIGGIGALGLAASVGSTNTVLAETTADNAIEAVGGNAGYGLRASGGLAPLFLVGGGSAGSPASGTHQAGELYVDSAGILYYCVTAGTPGTWRQVSGSTSSGVFHALSSPERYIDTRSNLGGSGALSKDTAVTFTLTNVNGASGGSGPVIPSGATAIVGNITVIQPTGPGFMTLYPGNAGSVPTTSNVNYSAGAVVGNNYTVGLSPSGTIKAVAQGGGGAYTVNFTLDVFGYYM
ncbi:MAG: hypothetical protein J0I20_32290 [Chloroflexi bacterium]|nr:hypothetical protein [Chloroflexota bacterium]OJV93169.1 MAG: hypothetical protein BGO39_14710 [Chloroflexi bacterium 54-19]